MLLWWLLLGAILIGTIAYTVSYVVTKMNIPDTIKKALESVSNAATKKALANGIEAVVKEAQGNVVKFDVLVNQNNGKQEKLDITINCEGVDETVKSGMKLKCAF